MLLILCRDEFWRDGNAERMAVPKKHKCTVQEERKYENGLLKMANDTARELMSRMLALCLLCGFVHSVGYKSKVCRHSDCTGQKTRLESISQKSHPLEFYGVIIMGVSRGVASTGRIIRWPCLITVPPPAWDIVVACIWRILAECNDKPI